MAAHLFFRALAELFPGSNGDVRKAHRSQPPSTSAHASTPAQPRTVGQGASNETLVTIADLPNLFVDEGDCIVQLIPAFDERPRDTRFGIKMLPDLAPHWSVLREHRVPLNDAIASAIRSYGRPAIAPAMPIDRNQLDVNRQAQAPDHEAPGVAPAQAQPAAGMPGGTSTQRADMLAATHGRVVTWGEEKFPNRKRTGKPFYTSFAMRIETVMGEQILQGEGLKDAIAESQCKVGDVVSVRRLKKIKVPAFRESGQPVMKDGQQVLWDKWLWSITH